MAAPSLLFELIIKLIITVVVIAVNAVLIREIASFFNFKDDSLSTAAAISVWLGAILFLFSFLTDVPFLGWILAVIPFPFMIYLIRRYYVKSWESSTLVWEIWTAFLLFIAILIYSISINSIFLVLWGLLPLALNIGYVIFMRYYRNPYISNAVVSVFGFIMLNVVWYSIFKLYFPI